MIREELVSCRAQVADRAARGRVHVENGLAKNRPDDILCSEASPLRAGACHRSSPLNGGRCYVSPRTAYRLSVLG